MVARQQAIPHCIVTATTRDMGRAARKPWFASRASIAVYEALATVYGRATGRL